MDESISHIQICENKSYYVVYRQDQEQGRKVFKNIAYCDKDRAMSKYSSIKNKYEVVAVVFDGRVIKRNIQRSFNLNRDFLNRYAESLK